MPHPDAPATPALVTPAEAGLRLIAHRLRADAAHLYDGAVLVAASSLGAPALGALAATLGDALALFDVSAVAGGPQFAAGQRAGEAALLVLGIDPEAADGPWQDAFAEALALARGLLPAPPPPDAAHGRLLHRVATHPGSLDERLALALCSFAEALGLDAAAFARVDDGIWTPEAAHDPAGLLPTDPTPITALPCAMTAYADGPVAVEDISGGPYIGAPVFAGGRTIGTLMAVGRAPRATPFSPDDRDLAEALARWVGSAVGGRDAARRIADREAALAAFVDRAPVAMALTTLDGGTVRFLSVNAAAARLLGRDPDALAGASPETAGVDPRTARAWAAGTRRALDREAGTSLPPITIRLDTPDGPRTLAATLTRLDVHGDEGRATPCVSFVGEDVTDREAGLRDAAERRRLAEAAAEEQAALLTRLHRDVRTPLTTILGYAELLGPDMPAGEPDEVRAVIERSAQQLLATLDATVALAEAARVSIALVPVDAVAVVREAVEAAAAPARQAGIDVQFVAAAARTPLLMDPALVGRVVQALVAEAVAVPGAQHVDARLSDDGSHLVFDIGVRATTTAAPRREAQPAFLDHFVGRLVERLGGVVDEAFTEPWRRTVRLPRHAAVVVDLPPEALSPEALLFGAPDNAPEPAENVALEPFGPLVGPVAGGSPFGETALAGTGAHVGA